MSFEKQDCDRCTRICYCMLFGLDWFCNACFESMTYETQQKKEIEKIMARFGQNCEVKC